MSSRVLRKLGLQGDKDINCLGDEGSDTEADFSSSSGAKKKKLNINRYDLLNQNSHSESEVKEDDDQTAGSMNAYEGAIDIKDASRRKKKKKKRKPGKTSTTNARSSEDNIEDEVERSVREVNEILGEVEEGEVGAGIVGPATRKSLLSIEHKSLNPNNELRKMFGSKIVHGDQVKKRGRGRGHLRSTWLVSPKDNWPQVGKPGLSMKLLETRNGVHYFTYEHSVNYQQVQMRFLDALESIHSDGIVEIINSHPYHVDALLQLSDLVRTSDDMSMAGELVERALYFLECAFHPSFSLATGNCRLDYRRQENRSLFVALFKHLVFVGSRACYRTAVEFCKLLLSLDPEGDPLATVLAVDFYALRAHQYSWLIRLVQEWNPTRNLLQLPNFAYSIALAHYHLGEMDPANSALKEALINFPGVLKPLLEKCSVEHDATLAYFNNVHTKQSQALTQLELLYVCRSYHLWKEVSILGWLEAITKEVVAMAAALPDHPSIDEAVRHRATRYPNTPLNVSRHLFLSDFPDIPIRLPEGSWSAGLVFGFDPLPPVDSIDAYSRAPPPNRRRGHPAAIGGLASSSSSSNLIDSDSPLSVFFRSITPSFNINQLHSHHNMGEDLLEEEEGGGGGGVNLRQSIVSLIDSMRDLLSNIHLPEFPGDDGDNEDDDDNPDEDEQQTP